MKFIPVLDLKKGLVVHAIKGQRERYQPVKSVLASTAKPIEVAHSLMKETQCRDLYIADLDAIQGKGHNRNLIREIADRLDARLWVDEGVTNTKSANRLVEAGADLVIVGSETLSDLEELKRLCDALTIEKIVFSIDLKAGKVLSLTPALKGIGPMEALGLTAPLGIERFILLTLDDVGSGRGPDLELLRSAKQCFSGKTFIVGGGVKTPAHLSDLSRNGAEGALVATALHRGWITGRDIAALR